MEMTIDKGHEMKDQLLRHVQEHKIEKKIFQSHLHRYFYGSEEYIYIFMVQKNTSSEAANLPFSKIQKLLHP